MDEMHMKIVLFMTITINGYIAKENDEAPWSSAAFARYYKIAKQFKAIILGRRTYEIMKEADEFDKIGNPFVIVLTTKNFTDNENITSASSPKEALKILKERKITKVLLGGGGKGNASFMKENLIDEIILDVEPCIFGKGIALFSQDSFDTKCELIKTKKVSKNMIELHYKVVR